MPGSVARQLLLPSAWAKSETVESFARAWAKKVGGELPPDALIHLRCPQCQWLHTLRVRGRTRKPETIERLLPRVPLRHWVFSLGAEAQPKLERSRQLRMRVGRACINAVFAWLRRAAARAKIERAQACGAVSAIHRVGAALNSNVHVHALVLDGVYTREDDGTPVFHPVEGPRRRDLRRTTAELRTTIDTLLARAPPAPGPNPSGSLHGAHDRTRTVRRVVQQPVCGPPVRAVPPTTASGLVQRCGVLDIRAGPIITADDRVVRARLCRYVSREPLDVAALSAGNNGQLRYQLRHPFADGTTHVEFSPATLATRLQDLATGSLRPPIAFHGMLAPGAAAAWLPTAAPRQLPLIPLPPRNGANKPRAPTSLRCPRCAATLDIVGVEPAPKRAA